MDRGFKEVAVLLTMITVVVSIVALLFLAFLGHAWAATALYYITKVVGWGVIVLLAVVAVLPPLALWRELRKPSNR